MKMTERAVTTVLGAVLFVMAAALLFTLVRELEKLFEQYLMNRSAVSVLEVMY